MGIRDRREREKDELRRKILSAVMDVIAESGHENLTIREIARRIEYSPRTIYLYFANKEALMHQVVEEGFLSTVRERAKRQTPPDDDPVVQVEAQIRAHIGMAFRRPNLYRAIVAVVSERDHEPGDAEQAIILQTRDGVRRLAGTRPVSEYEVAVLTDILFGSVRALALHLLNRRDEMNDTQREQYVSEFVQFVISGIRRV